jgi:predicted ATPase
LGHEDVEGLLRRLARVGSEPIGVPEESGKQQEGSYQARSELERFGTWLAAETGGQPFYFVETLKALLEEGKLVIRVHPDRGSVLEVGNPALSGLLPSSVREVIRGRLSRLSPAASELLAAGAVLGRGFGFEPLVGVAGLGQAEGLRGLDELTGRRLLLEEAGGVEEGRSILYPGPTYSFSHEKIRQVAYTEAGETRRWVLHRRAFEVLKGRGAPSAQLARHALAAGFADEAFEEAVDLGHYKAYSYARLYVLAALSKEWEVAHAKGAHELGIFFSPLFTIHLHH